MLRSSSSTGLWSLVIALGTLAVPACAADGPSADSQAQAKKVVQEWYAGLGAAKTASVEIAAKVDVMKDGAPAQSDESVYRFAFERPNKLALVALKGMGLAVIADDKQVYEYVEQKKQYQIDEQPLGSVSELSKAMVLRFVNFGQGMGILSDALEAPTFEALLADYASPEYVGLEDKNGAKTHHVRLTHEDMPYDLWFAADAPRLLTVSPDLAAGLAKQGQTLPPGFSFSMVIAYNKWTYDAPLPADTFKITPPEGAELVDDLFAPPVHRLVGQQAPAFETTSLDGVPVKLGDLIGKVVILDFWATWCGPCVAALPKINETAGKYKDKGVVFFAVNQGEEASIIKEFMAAQKLTAPVAMDQEGKIGTLYGVEGIPQTVVIDKQGKIQVVHVGAGPGIGEQLAKELDDVLAGKDLAAAKTKKK